ncbi:GPI-linked NAD(P)(+)--arginine ADP-ribosyltransferase 1-like [Salminus brasiliensis]|uniref:GPI-linked NAD(P)(+)--arginine ADP-ribosyltransferase 1-like n=1 Tax=Salminus brasiliensis TaxID=930266 RepID=UPI003B833DE1
MGVCNLSIKDLSGVKMAVFVVSVLFLVTVFLTIWKSSADVLPLDMAEGSVDDSYDGCKDAMNALVMSNYFEYEKKNTPGFSNAWKVSLSKYVKAELGKYQSVAIYMYTREPVCRNDCSYSEFNTATRHLKEAYKSGHFQFYTLHFFLTDAIQQLKQNQTGCVTTYRKTKVTFQTDVLNQTVRFGSFTSSSLVKSLTGFGNKSCFEVFTCFGAAVEKYSAFSNEREVLIPPYEVFRITSIEENTWCEVVYILKSVGKRSDLRCAKTNSSSAAGAPSLYLSTLLFPAVWLIQ